MKRFVFFSIAVLCIYAIVNLVTNSVGNWYLNGYMSDVYMIDCSTVDNYENLNQDKLIKLGGWIEVLNENYEVIYPKDRKKIYTKDDIANLINGSFEKDSNRYYGLIKSFKSKKDERRVQLTFFPEEKLEVTPVVSLDLSSDVIWMVLINLIGFIILAIGYIILVLKMSQGIKVKLTTPIIGLMAAMKRVGEGKYKERLNSKAEYEFIEMEKSFNQMAEALEIATKKSGEEEALRRQLISDLSHDIRTPLTSIQGYAITLLENKKTEQFDKYLKIIYQSTIEMRELLQHLIDYNKLQCVDYVLNIEKVDLSDFLINILSERYQSTEDAGMLLNVEIEEKCLEAYIDIVEFRRVIVNIFNNAVYHNKKGTEIFVTIKEGERKYEIIIADNGIKIDDRVKGKIFEPFVKGEESRSDSQHNGLGLSITKKIVEKHNGTIQLEEPYKHYTKAFIITINNNLKKH